MYGEQHPSTSRKAFHQPPLPSFPSHQPSLLPFHPPNFNPSLFPLQPSHYPPKFTSFDAFDSIRVILQNQELWQSFHRLGTEMILTRPGRRMFPTLKVAIQGLEPHKKYIVMIDFMSTDNHRYKFFKQQWVVAGRAEPQMRPNRIFVHSDSPALGSSWHSQIVSFSKVKLTNNVSDENGHIILNSQHKYTPRIHVVEGSDLNSLTSGRHKTFTFEETSFIAVTAYQNEEVTQLKINNNPFAKGFRRKSSEKKKLSSNSRVRDENMPETQEEGAPISKKQTSGLLTSDTNPQNFFDTSTPIFKKRKTSNEPFHPPTSLHTSPFTPQTFSFTHIPFRPLSDSFAFLQNNFFPPSNITSSDSGFVSHLYSSQETPSQFSLPPSASHESKTTDANSSNLHKDVNNFSHNNLFNSPHRIDFPDCNIDFSNPYLPSSFNLFNKNLSNTDPNSTNFDGNLKNP